jgi:hypothetical protein
VGVFWVVVEKKGGKVALLRAISLYDWPVRIKTIKFDFSEM